MLYKLKVAVLILNWNSYQETINCINKLKKSTYKYYSIIIVDNNSDDDSFEQIKKDFPGYEYIYSKKNLGYAGGNNLGIKKALENKADLIWILNNDTIPLPDTLENLVDTFIQYPDVGVAGSLILNTNKNTDNTYHYTFGKLCLERGGQAIHLNKPELIKEDIYDVGYVNGASIMFRPSVVKKVGLLPEEYFLYYEETEWCYRAQKAGWRTVINPKSKIYQPSYPLYPRQAFYLIRNRFIITNRLNGKGYIYIFVTAYQWIKTFLFNKEKRNFKIVYATIMGLVNGILGKKGKYNI